MVDSVIQMQYGDFKSNGVYPINNLLSHNALRLTSRRFLVEIVEATLVMIGFLVQQMLRRMYSDNNAGLNNHAGLQAEVIRKLISRAAPTSFGKQHDFSSLLRVENDKELQQHFRQAVPLFTYEQMHNQWWKRLHEGETDVCWPGKISYMALSSGTSQAASKFIPLSADGIDSVRRAGKQLAGALAKLPEANKFLGGRMLSINGSTTLQQFPHFQAGDFSGIMMNQSPDWYRKRIVPEKSIHAGKHWQEKLEYIVANAPRWKVSILSGFPVWMVPLLETIIEKYKLETIHDIWPRVRIFMHGGMSIEPYQQRIDACFGHPVMQLESYVASEGYLAHMLLPNRPGMQLLSDGGCFFEFIPFDSANFDETGEMLTTAKTCTIADVEANKPYALVLSNNSGAWRYLIGDVVTFVEGYEATLKWSGRTTQFINLTGEHVSIANLEAAFTAVFNTRQQGAMEFAVLPDTSTDPFVHRWLIATDNPIPDAAVMLDDAMCKLNDDYTSLRKSDLIGKPEIYWMEPAMFVKLMALLGKTDGQHKYPRVIAASRLPKEILSKLLEGEPLGL